MTIIDVVAKGYYKHEMIHALFSGYPSEFVSRATVDMQLTSEGGGFRVVPVK